MKLWAKLKTLSLGKKIVLGIASLFVVAGVFGDPQQTNQKQQLVAPSSQGQTQTIVTSKNEEAEIIETKTELVTQRVDFQSSTQNDPTLVAGKSVIATQGVPGERTVTYEITLRNGIETSRRQVSDEITRQPVNQVTRIGTKKEVPKPSASSSCSGGYINTYGNCVPSPGSNPSGASAKCRDGTYSYSQSRRGTCSHHGGVAQWL